MKWKRRSGQLNDETDPRTNRRRIINTIVCVILHNVNMVTCDVIMLIRQTIQKWLSLHKNTNWVYLWQKILSFIFFFFLQCALKIKQFSCNWEMVDDYAAFEADNINSAFNFGDESECICKTFSIRLVRARIKTIKSNEAIAKHIKYDINCCAKSHCNRIAVGRWIESNWIAYIFFVVS